MLGSDPIVPIKEILTGRSNFDHLNLYIPGIDS